VIQVNFRRRDVFIKSYVQIRLYPVKVRHNAQLYLYFEVRQQSTRLFSLCILYIPAKTNATIVW